MNALGMIEVLSIPIGIESSDTMMKTAAVDLVSAQTVCAGKFICVISGDVAAVRESVDAGVKNAGDSLIDSIVIPNIHKNVIEAINACSEIDKVDALGIMETYSLAAAVIAADTCVKAADIKLVEVRLGRGLGGKSFVMMTGEVAAVEAAIRAGESLDEVAGLMSKSVVIPSPNFELVKQLL